MAYTKNTWTSGDVVSSSKLNNIENGIEAISELTDDESTITEIYLKKGSTVYKVEINSNGDGLTVTAVA